MYVPKIPTGGGIAMIGGGGLVATQDPTLWVVPSLIAAATAAAFLTWRSRRLELDSVKGV